jgi:WD40 repeat protein
MDSSVGIIQIACFPHRRDRHRMGLLVLVTLGCIAWFTPKAWGMDGDTLPRQVIEIPRVGKLPFIAVEQISDSGRLLLASEAGLFEWQAPSAIPQGASTPVSGLTPSRIDTRVERIFDLKRSTTGELLAIAGGVPGVSGLLEVWNLRDQSLLKRWEMPHDVIYQVAWAPDSKRLAAACADGVCIADGLESNSAPSRYSGHSSAATTVAFLQDGQMVASGAIDQTIHVWHSVTGVGARVLDNHTAPVRQILLGPRSTDPLKGTILSASEDRTVRLWQPQLGRLVRFTKLPSSVSAMEKVVALPTDSRSTELTHMVVGCDDGTLHRIDLRILKSEQMDAPNLGRVYRLLRYAKNTSNPAHSVLILLAANGAAVIE